MSGDTAPPKPNKRLLQGARSREEILDAASRLMSSKGYDATSMSDIATESGLPSSSIYWHFSSKAGVLSAVMERGASRFFEENDRWRPPPQLEPRERLRWSLQRAGREVKEQPDFLRLFLLRLLLSTATGEIDSVVKSVRQRARGKLHEILYDAYLPFGETMATKVAEELADYAVGVFDGLFLASQADRALPFSVFIDSMADSLLALGDQIVERHER